MMMKSMISSNTGKAPHLKAYLSDDIDCSDKVWFIDVWDNEDLIELLSTSEDTVMYMSEYNGEPMPMIEINIYP